MGQFLNPGNSSFENIRNAEIYIDKSGIIDYTNHVIKSPDAFICNSRPRRFGKSYTAEMLTAYYGKNCDSHMLFNDLDISETSNYEQYINKFDVIHIDVQWFLMTCIDVNSVVKYMSDSVLDEVEDAYPFCKKKDYRSLSNALSLIHARTGNRFVIIMDEWDILIRDESANHAVQDQYIQFLRGMFKGSEPSKYTALAWLTGILPVKKLKTQSALNNFEEFTMITPSNLAPYIGFTDAEVKKLCDQYKRDFEKVKQWYDGYLLKDIHVYNPRAVAFAVRKGEFQSYWSSTGTFESIVPVINRNFDGLKDAIVDMLSGNEAKLNVNTFQNDMVSFNNRDDVMTLLIHLGYLAYDEKRRAAYVPNEEIRQELLAAVNSSKWTEFDKFREDSETLLEATLDQDAEAVAMQIEKIHDEYSSQIKYHDENSLSSVLTIAYLSSMEYYFRPIRELPSGRGFADFVYLPKPEYKEYYPALVVELKWNENVETALNQIHRKKYPQSVRQYTGDILLVGISYDKKIRKHACRIEKLQKD